MTAAERNERKRKRGALLWMLRETGQHTLRELAYMFEVSPERIRQISGGYEMEIYRRQRQLRAYAFHPDAPAWLVRLSKAGAL
jgi:DNA-directed RNA polymerase sigma subunit (sigma70/sigma32)